MIHRPRETPPPLFAGTANRLGCTVDQLRAVMAPGLARRDHPATAHAAAASVAPARRELHARLLAALTNGGLTDEEMQDRTGMNPSTQRPRRVELVDSGQVRDSGRRRACRSGRLAVVWEAAPAPGTHSATDAPAGP